MPHHLSVLVLFCVSPERRIQRRNWQNCRSGRSRDGGTGWRLPRNQWVEPSNGLVIGWDVRCVQNQSRNLLTVGLNLRGGNLGDHRTVCRDERRDGASHGPTVIAVAAAARKSPPDLACPLSLNTDLALSMLQAAVIAKGAHRHRTLAPEDPPERWTVLDWISSRPSRSAAVPDVGLAASTRDGPDRNGGSGGERAAVFSRLWRGDGHLTWRCSGPRLKKAILFLDGCKYAFLCEAAHSAGLHPR